jgi:hypothetical protein
MYVCTATAYNGILKFTTATDRHRDVDDRWPTTTIPRLIRPKSINICRDSSIKALLAPPLADAVSI